MRPQICATPKRGGLYFSIRGGVRPLRGRTPLVHFTMYPGPSPHPFFPLPGRTSSGSFFFFFPTGRTSSDFWVAETLQDWYTLTGVCGFCTQCHLEQLWFDTTLTRSSISLWGSTISFHHFAAAGIVTSTVLHPAKNVSAVKQINQKDRA